MRAFKKKVNSGVGNCSFDSKLLLGNQVILQVKLFICRSQDMRMHSFRRIQDIFVFNDFGVKYTIDHVALHFELFGLFEYDIRTYRAY